VYAKSFYAGRDYPSGPCRASASASTPPRDPAEIDAALDACLAYLETEPGSTPATTAEEPDRPVAFFPHVIASVGRYLAPLADIRSAARSPT
jgi:ethanolamine utilization microcompartment shell protein EutL